MDKGLAWGAPDAPDASKQQWKDAKDVKNMWRNAMTEAEIIVRARDKFSLIQIHAVNHIHPSSTLIYYTETILKKPMGREPAQEYRQAQMRQGKRVSEWVGARR